MYKQWVSRTLKYAVLAPKLLVTASNETQAPIILWLIAPPIKKQIILSWMVNMIHALSILELGEPDLTFLHIFLRIFLIDPLLTNRHKKKELTQKNVASRSSRWTQLQQEKINNEWAPWWLAFSSKENIAKKRAARSIVNEHTMSTTQGYLVRRVSWQCTQP